MKKPVIVTKTSWREFKKVFNLGLSVYESMNNNARFINPKPSLAVIMNSSNQLSDALALWGPVGNRGSHKDYVNLQAISRTQHLQLTQLGAWCMSSLNAGLSYSEQTSILSTSGFPLKNAGAPMGPLQAVRDLHRFIARSLSEEQVKIKWMKPLDVTTITNVKGYNIYRSATPDFSSASVIAFVTVTSYIDEPGSGTWFYRVAAVNNKGTGVPSSALMVKVV